MHKISIDLFKSNGKTLIPFVNTSMVKTSTASCQYPSQSPRLIKAGSTPIKTQFRGSKFLTNTNKKAKLGSTPTQATTTTIKLNLNLKTNYYNTRINYYKFSNNAKSLNCTNKKMLHRNAQSLLVDDYKDCNLNSNLINNNSEETNSLNRLELENEFSYHILNSSYFNQSKISSNANNFSSNTSYIQNSNHILNKTSIFKLKTYRERKRRVNYLLKTKTFDENIYLEMTNPTINYFAHSFIDRCSDKRKDEKWIMDQMRSEKSVFVLFYVDKVSFTFDLSFFLVVLC